MDKLTELNKLEKWLKDNKYDVERWDEEEEELPFTDFVVARHQVFVKNKEGGKLFDAICHPGSYGYEQGLIEIMNGSLKLTKDGDDDVEGWLTADEVVKRLEVIDN